MKLSVPAPGFVRAFFFCRGGVIPVSLKDFRPLAFYPPEQERGGRRTIEYWLSPRK
ncbi:hypothetical protein B4135_2295 [Caldibacillus debilis]|uniref:Uncharacterized protein n=1 Tax=Caldibacillus debilis TaxID=301148 RepID=A0A150M274_9BACI|nr:hypothetical protein B4135_2295 [Caldibacillus debilis]